MFENITRSLGLSKPKGEPDEGERKVEARPASRPASRPNIQEIVDSANQGSTPLPIGRHNEIGGVAVSPSQSPKAVRADVTPGAPRPEAVAQVDPIPSNLSVPTRAIASLFIGDGQQYGTWNDAPITLRNALEAIGKWDINPYGGLSKVIEGAQGWAKIVTHFQTLLIQLASLPQGRTISAHIEDAMLQEEFKKYAAQILGTYLIWLLVNNEFIATYMSSPTGEHLTNISWVKSQHAVTYKPLEQLGALLAKQDYSEIRIEVLELIKKLPNSYKLSELFTAVGLR